MRNVSHQSDTKRMYVGNHWFHASCISKWLEKNNTCPHCRQRTASSSMRLMPTDVAKGFVREGAGDTGDDHGSASLDDELRKSLESLQTRLDRIEKENAAMETKLENAVAERDHFATDNEQKTLQNEALQCSLNTRMRESSKWKMEFTRLQSTSANYQTQLEDLKLANANLELEKQRLNATTRSVNFSYNYHHNSSYHMITQNFSILK